MFLSSPPEASSRALGCERRNVVKPPAALLGACGGPLAGLGGCMVSCSMLKKKKKSVVPESLV